jgi:hypothetical protein
MAVPASPPPLTKGQPNCQPHKLNYQLGDGRVKPPDGAADGAKLLPLT